MKVVILAIGKCKRNSPEFALIAEYVKRCSWEIVIKEKDNSTQSDEAKFLIENIPHGAKVVVLDERGVNIKSTEFAAKIQDWMLDGVSEICFLIGGADGHLPSTRERADLILSFGKLTLPHMLMRDLILSFGKLTLPHMLMRAVLTEQIYRASTILNHHPYHRE